MQDNKSTKNILRWRIIIALLLVSILPLSLLGFGSWFVFERIIKDKSLDLQRNITENHARFINNYFDERLDLMQFILENYSHNELIGHDNLLNIFNSLNKSHSNSFVDLGVISNEGEHLSYIGPYSLLDKNYKNADWFQDVLKRGSYISDVFLGYRQVPHCIIAVKGNKNSKTLILRATINSEQFDSIVASDYLGTTGEAFIINPEGVYQTNSRSGKLMERSSIRIPPKLVGVENEEIDNDGIRQIRTITRLNHEQWLLLVQQNKNEILAPLRMAMLNGSLVIGIAMILVIVATVLATRHLTKQIDLANEQRDEMYLAFMRSAKLASIGELATGLAHEINNPLAIISSERTNISDIVLQEENEIESIDEVHGSLECIKHQIKRCSSITQKMLQFGRKGDTELKATNLDPLLRGTVNLLQRQATVRNIKLSLNIEKKLPEVYVDPVEFEQVLVNIINNAFYAIKNQGVVHVEASPSNDQVRIIVSDSGCGISPENLKHIFEPFFTTKPVGQGTGLGLSVSYGLITSFGGTIDAISQIGKGTSFVIKLPAIQHQGS